jgi:glycosyltransferase involved in cell wall biosynthesis
MASRRADLQRRCIGIVGRIEPAKGQLLLVEAVRRLRRDGYPCALQIWGTPGPSGGDYLQAVRRAADALDVQIMPGTEEMPRILADLDLLVVASINEGMPRVILEAFSGGVPVLACASGGIPEIVRDNETGFLVSDYSVEGIAQALARVLKASPADVQNVTANARRAWERDHTPELYRSRIAALISQTACSRGEEGKTPRLRRHTA